LKSLNIIAIARLALVLSFIGLTYSCDVSRAKLSNNVSNAKIPENVVIFGTRDEPKLLPLAGKRLIDVSEDIIMAIIPKIALNLDNEYRGISGDTQKKKQIENILRNIKDYYYQCYAYANNGKEYIHINAFNNAVLKNENWKTEIVNILDGGEVAWRIDYCLTDEEFEDIEINGYS